MYLGIFVVIVLCIIGVVEYRNRRKNDSIKNAVKQYNEVKQALATQNKELARKAQDYEEAKKKLKLVISNNTDSNNSSQ